MSEMSNNTVPCNLTQNQYRAITLAYGLIGLLTVVICGLILGSLLLIHKKKAWESPVKRLYLVLAISIALSSLTFALAGFYTSPPTGWCITIGFLIDYCSTSTLLYFNALLMALLLQVSGPIIPETWKHTQRYIPTSKCVEGTIHILIPILTLLIDIPIYQRIFNHCNYSLCDRMAVLYEVLVGIFLALSIIILFVTITVFSYYFIKFYRTRVITKTTKWAMIRLSIVFVIVILFLIYYAARIAKPLTYMYHNIIVMMVEIAVLFLFVMLIYLPSTQCYKCYKRTPVQLPLLPNTEMQHTNPPSEWDHSNVPSITVSVHPNEMSDCETDHVSSLTIPGPKYGTTTHRT